jgi:hypothetical protein
MKFFLTRYVLILIMFSIHSTQGYYKEESCGKTDVYNSCTSCCESIVSPLCPCTFDIELDAGVAPIVWRNRTAVQASSCSISQCAGGSSLFSLFNNTPKFSKFFHVPWVIGAQLGYAWNERIRTFVEFNYVRVNGKKNVLINSDVISEINTIVPITFSFDAYKVFDCYVGAHYYWGRWCNRYSIFAGALLGLARHRDLRTSLSFVNPAPLTPMLPHTRVFEGNTVISGGGDVGVDICFCNSWSFVLTARVLASCGPRAVNNVDISTITNAASITNISFGGMETELRFPITAGLRYTF